MKRVVTSVLSLLLCISALSFIPSAAAAYRPIMILERMDLSKGLAEPFSASKTEDVGDSKGKPLAVGTVENDSTKGKVLHISNRSGSASGLSVNLKKMQESTGDISYNYNGAKFVDGEYYALTFSIRAAKGKSFYIMPVMGGGGTTVWNDDKTGKLTDNNGYLGNPEARHKVTDQWTTIGVTADGELAMFMGDETYKIYRPNLNSWCGLYFVTFTDPDKGIWDSKTSEDYYISDLCVWGPKKLEANAAGFVDGASRLPVKEQTTRSIENTVSQLEKIYNGLSASERQRSDVAAAKKTLDSVKTAMTSVRRPYSPVYNYKDPENLLAPYGDLESFDGSTFIWGEPKNGKPKFTLVEDASVAKQGKKCLLISERDSRGDLSIDVTPIIKANGGGKYYFSCWMKTREKGVSAEVLPLVLYVKSETDVTEYEIGETIITDEWTFVGVTIQEINRYFANQQQGLADIGNNVNYAALRFYTADTEADEGGNMFPDFYIDDLKFWKDSEKLPGYVPAPTVSTPESSSQISSDNESVPSSSETETISDDKSAGTAGLIIGISAGAAVLIALFAVFWFVIRPKMLAAAGQIPQKNSTDSTVDVAEESAQTDEPDSQTDKK